MKKPQGVLALVAAMALLAAPAMATLVEDPWDPGSASDELNLYEIVNALYGTSFASSAAMLSAQVAAPLDEVFSGGRSIVATAHYASYVETFGWYQYTGMGDPTTLMELFSVETEGLGNLASASISPVGDYGFYAQAGPADEPDLYTWFSESDENPHGEDHLVLYDLGLLVSSEYDGSYLMAWEDMPTCMSDQDYQDLVIELNPGGDPPGVVPEPSSIMLLGLGVAGILVRRFRSA